MIEDCKELCDFYCNLVEKVSEFSFQLESNGNTRFSNKISSHPFESPDEEFTEEASDRIRNLFQAEISKRSELYKAGMLVRRKCSNSVFDYFCLSSMQKFRERTLGSFRWFRWGSSTLGTIAR